MVQIELVQDVNAELRKILTEARTGREHPLIIRILEQMVRVTNTDAQMDADEAIHVPSATNEREPLQDLVKKVDPALCQHKVSNIYGLCTACGKCLHTQNNGETCNTCGEPISKATDFSIKKIPG